MTNIIKSPKIQSKPISKHVPTVTVWQPKTLKAACGCLDIDTENEAYIYSKTEEKAYCDLVCLCNTLGFHYTDEVRDSIKEEYKIVSHG